MNYTGKVLVLHVTVVTLKSSVSNFSSRRYVGLIFVDYFG